VVPDSPPGDWESQADSGEESYDPDMTSALHEHALFAGRPVYGGVVRVAGAIGEHTHDFIEVAVVGPGEGVHRTSRGAHRLRHGDVVVLRPGARHGFTDCSRLTVANCCVSAQAVGAELSWLRDIPAVRRLLWTDPVAAGSHGVLLTTVDPDAATEAIKVVGQLERDLSAGRSGRVLGRLVTVLGILTDGRSPAPAEPAVHPAVAAAVAMLEQEPAEPWRLDALAAAVNLDPAYLGRLFRRYTGLPPMEFLARVRAERAATLLARTALPVARVGAAVGWDDPTYFARRFRTLLGITPSEYRRRAHAGPLTAG